jgi:hypothetical protein
MLPTFLVIGSLKGGTTSLVQYLSTHPDVFMPENKETGFFVERLAWRCGLDWYEDLFADAGHATAIGEASPTYTLYPSLPGVPERIASVLPDVRLVYVVRHPIERMRSQYLHAVAREQEHRTMTRAFLETPEYMDGSRYATQIDQYLQYFDPAQLLVVTSESLRDDRAATVRRVFEFIGVDPDWVPPNLRCESHRTRDRLVAAGRSDKADIQLPDNVERYLQTCLRDEVKRCASWLDPDFDGWGLL